MPILHGACFCGAVGFSVELDDDPARAARQVTLPGYCTCHDCRRAHASALVEGAFVASETFTWTRGEDRIKHYRKGRGPVRSFCTECGTRVANQLPGAVPGVCIFPALLAPEVQRDLPAALRPTTVFFPGSAVLHLDLLRSHVQEPRR